MRTPGPWLASLLSGLSLCLMACSTSGGGTGGLPAAWCAPGATQPCLCAVGVAGVQVCRDDAKGWQACACGTSIPSDGAGGDGNSTGDGATQGDGSATDGSSSDGGPSDSKAVDQATADAWPEDAAIEDSGVNKGDGDETDWGNYFDDATEGSDTVVQIGPDAKVQGDCPERAKIVYVVTQENVLLSFQPDELKLKPIGKLGCPAPLAATPFSMSVDRNANAWVLYQNGFSGGSVYKVSTLDASCQATGYQSGQQGFELFGMGFSANAAQSPDETLWVAGTSSLQFSSGACKLGNLDTKTMQLQKVSGIPGVVGCPDLTGNGLGELYGFFPNTVPPSVRQLDKITGATVQSWALPNKTFSGSAAAWAFAQWGGDLYLFFDNEATPSTTIWKLNPATGQVVAVMPNIGYTVTGAGVSSCAPSQAGSP